MDPKMNPEIVIVEDAEGEMEQSPINWEMDLTPENSENEYEGDQGQGNPADGSNVGLTHSGTMQEESLEEQRDRYKDERNYWRDECLKLLAKYPSTRVTKPYEDLADQLIQLTCLEAAWKRELEKDPFQRQFLPSVVPTFVLTEEPEMWTRHRMDVESYLVRRNTRR